MRRELSIRADDDHRWTAELFTPERPRAAILFCAGMGVEASYYRPLAEALARRDIAVVLSDLRGNGSSSLRPSRSIDFGLRELCELDLPAAIAEVQAALPGLPLVIGGHSLGGQAAALYAARFGQHLDGLLLIASCLIDHRLFSGLLGPGAHVAGHVFPAVARALGWFPGQLLGFGKTEARTLMADWGRVVRTGEYQLAGTDIDYEAELARSHLATLAVSFTDDSWAPKAAVDGLLGKMPRATATHLHLAPADVGRRVDHFRWTRSSGVIAVAIDDWTRVQISTERGSSPATK